MREIPHSPVALHEVVNLFGTLIAETILASVRVRARKQAGHMGASDLINAAAKHLAKRAVHIWGIRVHTRETLLYRGGLVSRFFATAYSLSYSYRTPSREV